MRIALVTAICLATGLVYAMPLTRTETCIGTQFAGPGDRWAGERFLCNGIRTTVQGIRGVAHRWLPCGTLVHITNPRTKRTTTAKVIDRGPYKAWPKLGGKWKVLVRRRAPRGWRFDGCLDMTPPVIKDLGHNGREKVRVRYTVRRPRS